jgi:hypothetical protein
MHTVTCRFVCFHWFRIERAEFIIQKCIVHRKKATSITTQDDFFPVFYSTWGQSWNRSHRLATWRGKIQPSGLICEWRLAHTHYATLLQRFPGRFQHLPHFLYKMSLCSCRLSYGDHPFYFKFVVPSKLNAFFHLTTLSIRLKDITDCWKLRSRSLDKPPIGTTSTSNSWKSVLKLLHDRTCSSWDHR